MSKTIGDILGLSPQKCEIISYGISVIVINAIGLIAILAIGYIVRVFIPTLAMVSMLLVLRPNAGGAHCSSPLSCNIFGCIFIPIFALWASWLSSCPSVVGYIYIGFSTVISMLGIYLNAPYFTQEKPRAEERSRKLKIRSLVIAASGFFISVGLLIYGQTEWSMGVTTGLLFQGIMILPLGIEGTKLLDNFMNKLFLAKGGETE